MGYVSYHQVTTVLLRIYFDSDTSAVAWRVPPSISSYYRPVTPEYHQVNPKTLLTLVFQQNRR